MRFRAQRQSPAAGAGAYIHYGAINLIISVNISAYKPIEEFKREKLTRVSMTRNLQIRTRGDIVFEI